jgi:hypothetical protein
MEPGAPPGFLFCVNFPMPEEEAKVPPWPPRWPDKVKERIESAWALYEVMCRKAERVDDDRVPFLTNVTGTEIFAEAFGCKVQRPDDTNPFALPLVHSAAEADALKVPDLSTSSLAYLFDIADELHRRGGPDALMKTVDIQSPMDTVALIWDKSDLFCAMIETPEAVKALGEKVNALFVAFFDEWFRRYGTTYIAHCPDYVMYGGITMSVDEVGSINEEMFRAFFRDELVALSEHYGGLGIHCCADARHQWENFRSLPGLRLMNHNSPPWGPHKEYVLDSMRFYGNTCAQMPGGWQPEGEPDTWINQYPEGTRVIFGCNAEDADKAAALADRLQALRADNGGARQGAADVA